jgi:hypothetical protein
MRVTSPTACSFRKVTVVVNDVMLVLRGGGRQSAEHILAHTNVTS